MYTIGLCLATRFFHHLTYQVLQGICLASTIVTHYLGIIGYHLLYNPLQTNLIANGCLNPLFLDNSFWHFTRTKSPFYYFLCFLAFTTPLIDPTIHFDLPPCSH